MYYNDLLIKTVVASTMITICNVMKIKWINKQNNLIKNEKLFDNLKFDEISRKNKC